MSIHTVRIGSDNYAYVIAHRRQAAVVDPGEAQPVLRLVGDNALELSSIFITHHHGDHSGGAAQIKRATGCRVVGPLGGVDDTVRGGDVRRVGEYEIRVLATPGHTRADLSYYVPALKAIFTGDTMFVCGCGRLLGGDAAMMWKSLCAIAALGDDTLVYPGHDYTEENLRFALSIEPGNEAVQRRLSEVRVLARQGRPTVPSSIALEKQTSVFLRAGEAAVKNAVGMPRASDVEVFAELRRRKDRF